MIAYKFLRAGGEAPFTRFRWRANEWVEVEGVAPCRAGVHACRPRDLPYWLGAELWEIELDGAILEQERKIVAARGRLLRRRGDWNVELLDAFADDLLRQTRRRFGFLPVVSGYVGDIQRFRSQGRFGLAAFAAARAAELDGGPRAYERERLRQAAWLARRLGLPGG